MTNNEIYKRLSGLFEKLGISFENGSREKGELMAYCTGIDSVQAELDLCFNQVFADTASGLGLSLFCELLSIDSSMDIDEKRRLIKQGLSQTYGDYIFGTMQQEIEKLGNGFSMTAEDFCLTIGGSVKGNFDSLFELGKILEKYLPPCTVAEFSGDGLDFDYWDSTPYLFEDYDNFNLSFEFLDTLN
ncbi:MAG: hypothetical protein ACI4RF_03765 [Eubacterium sp.]